MVSEEVPASSREGPSSFFIGLLAEQPASAQLVASSVASRTCQDSSLQESRHEVASRDCQDSSIQKHCKVSSLRGHIQEALQSFQSSKRTFSRSSFAALMCANIFATVSFVSFKIYRLLVYGMLSFVQLSFETISVIQQYVLIRTATWTRALRTTTSFSASKSLSAARLQRTWPATWWMLSLLAILLFSFLGDAAFRTFQLRACMLSIAYLQDPASQ